MILLLLKKIVIFKYQIKSYYMMLTGTDKDPNTCQYCNESFSRANELVIHYQEKHPEIFRENKE